MEIHAYFAIGGAYRPAKAREKFGAGLLGVEGRWLAGKPKHLR
jgi:hypothetical protein